MWHINIKQHNGFQLQFLKDHVTLKSGGTAVENIEVQTTNKEILNIIYFLSFSV